MGFRKASLLLCFLFFLHLQHHFLHVISRSTTRLASTDPNPVQSVESKAACDAFAGKTPELAIVINKGGGGGRGGGGRGFGGGGRSFGGRGRGRGDDDRERSSGGGRVVPFVGGGGASHHGGHRSSGGRESASVWLGLSTLLGLVLVL